MSDQGDGAESSASRLGSSQGGSSEYPTDPLPKVTDAEPTGPSAGSEQPPFEAQEPPLSDDRERSLFSPAERPSFDDHEQPNAYEDEDFDVFTPYSERSHSQQQAEAWPTPAEPSHLDPSYPEPAYSEPSPLDAAYWEPSPPDPSYPEQPHPEPEPEWSDRPWSDSPLDAHEEPVAAAPEHGDEWVFAQQAGHEPEIEMPPPPPADRLPGKPTSGNMKMPDWMREGNNDDDFTGADSSDGRRSKVPLLVGIVILVVALIVAAGVVLFRQHSDGGTKAAIVPPPAPKTSVPSSTPSRAAKSPAPQKPLEQFAGAHTPVAGRMTDTSAGLSYARFGKPWELPPQKGPMSESGFSSRQYVVTEKSGTTPTWWGRLMSTMLSSGDKSLYGGPGTERKTATQVALLYESRLYGFRHQTRQVASQSLTISGHKGWLVGYYLTYHRPKVKATGEICTVAVVDTGKARPGVLFMSIPDTNKKLWPDFNYVLHSLKVT
jgi:hypothetical protein